MPAEGTTSITMDHYAVPRDNDEQEETESWTWWAFRLAYNTSHFVMKCMAMSYSSAAGKPLPNGEMDLYSGYIQRRKVGGTNN